MKNIVNKKNYFAGWYFKNMNENNTIAFIPSYHIDNKGKLSGSLQVITDDSSYNFEYLFNEFYLDNKNLFIKLGNSEFSERGINVNIKTDDIEIKGNLAYSALKPPKYDVMGPLCTVPFLQCRHWLLSFQHSVNGTLEINGKKYQFNDGIGYLEKDSGKSFPKKYLWTQCNIKGENDCTIMLSIATIKILFINFEGTICSIYFQGKEYRLATYLGAKIIENKQNYAKIKQGNLVFSAEQLTERAHDLKAPINGLMARTIRESLSCKVRYLLVKDEKVIFDLTSERAGFEYSDTNL